MIHVIVRDVGSRVVGKKKGREREKMINHNHNNNEEKKENEQRKRTLCATLRRLAAAGRTERRAVRRPTEQLNTHLLALLARQTRPSFICRAPISERRHLATNGTTARLLPRRNPSGAGAAI